MFCPRASKQPRLYGTPEQCRTVQARQTANANQTNAMLRRSIVTFWRSAKRGHALRRITATQPGVCLHAKRGLSIAKCKRQGYKPPQQRYAAAVRSRVMLSQWQHAVQVNVRHATLNQTIQRYKRSIAAVVKVAI